MLTFSTDAEFAGAIAATLESRINSADLRQALVAGIAVGEEESRAGSGQPHGGLNLRLDRWVLRDQDIPVTELIGVVAAAATAMLVPGTVVAAAMVTAVSSFAALAWKAWRKGAKLSKPEIAVLGFLEVHGPMTLEELKRKAPAALEDVTEGDVERALRGLEDVELRDGEIVSLVRQDSSGLWKARPI